MTKPRKKQHRQLSAFAGIVETLEMRNASSMGIRNFVRASRSRLYSGICLVRDLAIVCHAREERVSQDGAFKAIEDFQEILGRVDSKLGGKSMYGAHAN